MFPHIEQKEVGQAQTQDHQGEHIMLGHGLLPLFQPLSGYKTVNLNSAFLLKANLEIEATKFLWRRCNIIWDAMWGYFVAIGPFTCVVKSVTPQVKLRLKPWDKNPPKYQAEVGMNLCEFTSIEIIESKYDLHVEGVRNIIPSIINT